MAQIDMNNLKQIDKSRNTIHEKVYTTYTVFEQNFQKFLQIDTYGKVDRKFQEKISQSLQFDKETAAFFVELLKKEFELD